MGEKDVCMGRKENDEQSQIKLQHIYLQNVETKFVVKAMKPSNICNIKNSNNYNIITCSWFVETNSKQK